MYFWVDICNDWSNLSYLFEDLTQVGSSQIIEISKFIVSSFASLQMTIIRPAAQSVFNIDSQWALSPSTVL